jgi:hypothetical protein
VFHQDLNCLVQAAVALFKLYRLTRLPGSSAPVVTKQALLETFTQVVFAMQAEQEEGEEEESSVESS